MIGKWNTLWESLQIRVVYFAFFFSATLTANTASSTKCLKLNEKSSTLWHKRLGHISR